MSSRCSLPPPRKRYDVFLNFRGEDVRRKIISHLYEAMQQKKIPIFKDDQGVAKGDKISPALFQAIEASRISVVTFSRDYASSKWCLEELVKIMECKKTKGQVVIPVFYDVTPSEVRNQSGSFMVAFVQHETEFEEVTVLRWRNALKAAGKLSGWNLSDARDEAELVKQIVEDISKKLNQSTLSDIGNQFKKIVGFLPKKANPTVGSDLRSQVENLINKAQLHEVELERTTKQLKEMLEIAAEEAARHEAAEVIELLALQLKDMAEKLAVRATGNIRSSSSGSADVSSCCKQNDQTACEEALCKGSNNRSLSSGVSPASVPTASENKLVDLRAKESANKTNAEAELHKMKDVSDTSRLNGQTAARDLKSDESTSHEGGPAICEPSARSQRGHSNETATSNSQTEKDESFSPWVVNEWTEQPEPGVYITVLRSRGGPYDIKRVRFSRRRFTEPQALRWWEENKERVYEIYNWLPWYE